MLFKISSKCLCVIVLFFISNNDLSWLLHTFLDVEKGNRLLVMCVFCVLFVFLVCFLLLQQLPLYFAIFFWILSSVSAFDTFTLDK